MEALLFMVNSFVIIVLAFQGLRNDRRPAGTPEIGYFRTRDLDVARMPVDDERTGRPLAPDPWDIHTQDHA